MGMKKLILTTAVIAALSNICHAQAEKNNLSVTTDFKEMSGLGRMQTQDAIQTYKSGAVTGTQFYSNWSPGSVTTTRDEVINSYLLLYDKVRQELFIRPKDSSVIVLADKSQVKSFNLSLDKPHVFVKASTYDPKQGDNFFEVIVQGNYTLLKLTKTNFEKADYSDMLKVKAGDMSDAFVDNITYYIYHKGTLEKTGLKEKAILKSLPDQSAKVENYLNLHDGEDFTEQLLTGLVSSLN